MGSSVRPGDGGGVGGRDGLGWAPWQTGGRVRGSGSSWKGVRCWEQVLSLVVAVCPLGTSFLPLPLELAEGGSRTPIGPHNLILDIRPFLLASPTLPRVWMGSEDPVRPPQEGWGRLGIDGRCLVPPLTGGGVGGGLELPKGGLLRGAQTAKQFPERGWRPVPRRLGGEGRARG